MSKALFIAEKPSVAREFANALHEKMTSKDGYMESDSYVITWCVGHLVTMSYPDKYDEAYAKWSLETLPFIPHEFKYEIIPSVASQFKIVSTHLNREDVEIIYGCTDSGREGEYIYRLVAMMAGVGNKAQKRVWIDSQTEEEILRGIREAKDISEYDNLSAAAYLRAKEDYLMGINFSRVLSLKYGYAVSRAVGGKYQAISVGRVMTCVLGMVVRREREIRNFKKTSFYRVMASLGIQDKTMAAEWKAVPGSRYENLPMLYKENGFNKRQEAEGFVKELGAVKPQEMTVKSVSNKKETKNPPLLFNLAELQNECSRRFKLSPDKTLQLVQELYEKKLVTYPRTDARVLSTAAAKEIHKNLNALSKNPELGGFAEHILKTGAYKGISKSRYTNDKQITDHYAIIPTGQKAGRLSDLSAQIYELIARRFLSMFYPPAIYRRLSLTAEIDGESFGAKFKLLKEEGYLCIAGTPKEDTDATLLDAVASLRKGNHLSVKGYEIKEGETSPPKRYTSGSMILAMENAGQLIEDEDLRAQIKGSGIGTSATRAEILKKLFTISYLSLNNKTQVITPTHLGEMITDVVALSVRPLLNPSLTASWEKGLTYVANGEVTSDEYMKKLEAFISKHTAYVKTNSAMAQLTNCFAEIEKYYA